ncbi:conserved Plasmodium protein, unknown function [Plasmodium berghei]|uniref:Uncharacterized protein n=2 Tax=Plasmodium berghei TaxID=5821 RepID=A0A509B1G2_PLABA|nr:conserved Plasmodium protein, unknown function [Plasmodium berghei ANKA]SCM26917.1 conserved Plasmodium protein, unknown function [Plasmodium berghei]SCN28701.1 conserved Plasmodium protein, unknown function [Plasmodium berghei]SCO64449.1 conserved Plasmodium protein, unknown function [Plasmodium berghei]VUC58584.1 conserved Plasmodium protein, unknown function [Plasmodium berghei ANKA]|eukprot:XP_034424347.1 conserved Plasmodium protein, unknown function [Plasmodium berghei ANKA]
MDGFDEAKMKQLQLLKEKMKIAKAQKTDDISKKVENSFSHDVRNVRSFESEDMKFNKPGKKIFDIFSTNKKILHPKANRNIFQQSKNATNLSFKTKNENGILANDTEVFDTPLTFEEVMRRKNEKKKLKVEKNPQSIFSDILNNKQDNISPEKGNKNNLVSAFNGTSYNTTNNSNLGECHRLEQNNFNIECSEKNSTYTGIIPTNNNSADNINNRIGGDLIKNPNVLSSGNMDTKLALETKEIKNSSSLNLNTFNNLFQENNPKNQSNPNNSNNINNNAVSQQRNILSESLPLNFESQNARMNILNNVNNNGKFSNININNMGKFNNTNNSINNSSSRLFDMNLGAQMKDFQQIQQPANNNASLFGGAHQLNEFNLNKSGNFNNSNSGFNNSMNKSGIFSNLRNTINNADCSESKNMTNANNIFNSKSNTGNMGNSYGSIIKPNITNNANITNNNENINNHNEGAKFINSNSKNNMFNNTSPSNTSSIFSKTSSLFNKTPSLESNIFGTTGNNAFKNVSNNTVPNNQFNNTINPSKYSGNIISNEKNIFTSSNINQTIFGANIIPPTSIITNNTVQKQNNIYDNSIGNNNNFTQKSLQNNIFNNDKNNVHNNAQNSVQNNIFSNKIVENKNIFSPNNNLNNSVGSKLNFSNVNSNAMPNNNEQVKIMKFKNTLSQVKNMKMNSENTAIQNSNNFPINSSEVVTKNENDFSNQPSTDQKISEQTNNTHLTKINLNDNNVSAISDQNKNSDNIVDLSSNNINDDKEGKNLRKTISTYFNNLIPSIFSNSSKFVQSTNNTKESNTNKPTETSVHPSEINSNDNSKSHNLNEKVINTESINNSVVENANSVNMIPQTCNENNVANNNFSNKFTLDNNIGNVNIENKKTDSVFSNPSNTNVPNNGKPLFINQNSSLFGINQDNNVFVNGENVFGANNIFSSNNNHGINVNKLSSLNNNNTQNRGNNKVLLSLSRDMKTNLYENNSINNDKGVSGMTSNTTNHDIFQKNKNNSFINLNSKDFENKEDFEKFDKIYKNINCIDKNINYINKYAPENIKNTNNYIDENSNAIKNYEALSAANKLLLEKMNNPDNTTESNKEMKGIIDQLNKNINKNGEETDKYEENKANNKLHENKINIRNTEKGNNLSNMTLGKTLFETQMKNNGIEKSGTLGFNINTNELTPIQKLKLINETSKEISTNDESDLNEMIPEHVQKIMKRREYFKTKNKLLKTETDQASVKKMKPFVPTKYSESFRNTFYTNENNKNNIFSLKNLNTMGILDTQNYTQNYTKNNNELISGNTQNNLDFKSIIYNNDYNTHTPITGNLRNGSNATNISNSNNCSKFPQMINNICTNENIANMENELNSQTDFVSNIYKSLDKENYIYGKRDRNNFNIDDKNCINKNNNSSENISNFVNNNLTPEHEYLNCETKKKKSNPDIDIDIDNVNNEDNTSQSSKKSSNNTFSNMINYVKNIRNSNTLNDISMNLTKYTFQNEKILCDIINENFNMALKISSLNDLPFLSDDFS